MPFTDGKEQKLGLLWHDYDNHLHNDSGGRQMELYLKASEVVELLQRAISEHGDLPINVGEDDRYFWIATGVEVHPESYSPVTCPDYDEPPGELMLDNPRHFRFAFVSPGRSGETHDKWCESATRGFSYYP